MINWLFCQFHSHLLVNDNLSANLCDGLLDSATFLDSVGCDAPKWGRLLVESLSLRKEFNISWTLFWLSQNFFVSLPQIY